MITLDEYIQKVERHRGEELSAEDWELISTAFEIGQRYHAGQKRANGDDYFEGHCVPVSLNVASLNMDGSMIAAALVHDTLEDT